MKDLIALIMRNAYASSTQQEEEEKEFELLLAGRSMPQMFASILDDPVPHTVASIERWTARMQKQGVDPGLIGDRLHNFCGLLDLAFECSEDVQPNPFWSVGDGLLELGDRYPRSRRLVAVMKEPAKKATKKVAAKKAAKKKAATRKAAKKTPAKKRHS